jgi:hypothetical protein
VNGGQIAGSGETLDMATRSSPSCAGFGTPVPMDDVAIALPSHIGERRSVQAALALAGAAAWLAWQIETHEVNVDEARYQLDGIADDFARFRGRFPEPVQLCVRRALDDAQSAATGEDLSAAADAARRIRVVLDRYRSVNQA